MDEAVGTSNAIPPFLSKTYEMVEDSSTDSIVSWSEDDKSFVVWNPPDFARELLPKFFKHSNFSSFIRQLNTYGFRKVDPERWEFSNEYFIRDQPKLLKNIYRRKPVHSHSISNQQGQGTSGSLAESEREELKDVVERLKHEKNVLTLEIQKHQGDFQRIESQMFFLKERLQQRNEKQQDMVSYLARVLQKPGLAVNLLPLSQAHDRKRRLPRTNSLHEEEENQTVNFDNAGRENAGVVSSLGSVKELYELLESSVAFWENVLHDFCDSVLCSPLELDESTDCEESPTISYIQLEIQPKSSSIDMNCEPPAVLCLEPHVVSCKGKMVGNVGVAAGANDVFWEQFLTENPGSSEVQEVQSERKDPGYIKRESELVEHDISWLSRRNVNPALGQIGKT